MPTDKIRVSAYVDDYLINKLDKLAEEERSSLSKVTTAIIENYFNTTQVTKDARLINKKLDKLALRILKVEQKVDCNENKDSLPLHSMLTVKELQARLGEPDRVKILKNRERYKNDHMKFANWSKRKDPKGVAWIPYGDNFIRVLALSN